MTASPGSLIKMVLSSILLALTLFAGPVYALKTYVIEGRDAIILFPENLKPVAEEAITLYPDIKADLEEDLRWKVNFKPTVMLVQDSEVFQRMTGSRLIVAFAVPDRNLMVIDYSKMKLDPFTLEATIKHELCHLLLHNNIEKGHLPRWLDEGIAQWVSGGLADIIMNKNSSLDQAVLSGRYLSLRSITHYFPRDGKELSLAYAESKSLAEYMIDEFGLDRVLMVLDYLRGGDQIDTAVLKAFSISLDGLEVRWHRGLKKKTAWLSFLAGNLYEILFFMGALAMIIGFLKAFLRKRAYKKLEDDDSDSLT